MKNTERKTPYTSLSVTPAAREALRQAVPVLTGAAGRVVNASEALAALVAVGLAHLDETVAALNEPKEGA